LLLFVHKKKILPCYGIPHDWAIVMSSLRHEIRTLSSSVRSASDEQIAQVVATIDRMEKRGVADALVAPLRGRLRALAVRRPQTLRRISFEPLDPLILNNSVWKREQPFVPRSVLIPLFDMMRRGNPEFAHAEMLLPRAESDSTVRALLCTMLWRFGAGALRIAQPPHDWRQTSGLSDQDFRSIRSVVVGVLEQADRLRALDPRADETQILVQLREILIAAARSGGLTWQAILVLLFSNRDFVAYAVRLGQELAIAPELAIGLNAAFSNVSAVLQNRLDGLSEAACFSPLELADMVDVIVDLEAAAGPRSERKRIAEVLRRNANQLCAKAVTQTIDRELMPALKRDGNEVQPEVQSLAEAAARSARTLGLVAERLGVGDKYEARARKAIVFLNDPANCLDPVDRARLLEIMGRGTEAREVLRGAGRALEVAVG